MNERVKRTNLRTERAAWLLALLLLAAGPALAGDERGAERGYVDGSAFTEIAGDDAVTLEVNLHGALLRAMTRVHPEIAEAARGLQSIHGIVITLEQETQLPAMRELAQKTERRLLAQGWERMTRIKDRDAEVKLLVLNDDEAILGLVVLVVGADEVVFANIAGVLDLAKLAAIGEELDLPGLDVLGD